MNLEISGLHKSFDQTSVLSGVTLECRAGDRLIRVNDSLGCRFHPLQRLCQAHRRTA